MHQKRPCRGGFSGKCLCKVHPLSLIHISLNELEDKGISRAVLDNLCTKGVLECSKVNKSIDLYASIPLRIN